jgi:hypothetical protein
MGKNDGSKDNRYQLAEKIVAAVLSTKHSITHESVTLHANGSGKNARAELQQRIESVARTI